MKIDDNGALHAHIAGVDEEALAAHAATEREEQQDAAAHARKEQPGFATFFPKTAPPSTLGKYAPPGGSSEIPL